MNGIQILRLLIFASAFQGLFVTGAIVPHEVGEWPSPAGLSRSDGPVQTDMAIRGDKAFVGVRVFGQPGRLVIFDLAEGPNPVKLGQVELSSSNMLQSISVSGNLAYIAGRFTPSAIDIVDISDLAHPQLAGVLFLPNFAYNISVIANKNFAYIYGPASELIVADLSNPSSPQIVRTVPYRFAAFYVEGSQGFGLVSGAGLKVFDLTDPANPTLIGGSPTIGGSSILVSGSVGFVGKPNSLSAIDLRDPAAPKLISSLDVQGGVTPLAKRGNILASSRGFLFDVDNATNILNVGWLGVEATVRAASNAFVTFSPDNGLRVFDATDPKHPVTTGFYPMGTGRPHTRPADSHVYVTFRNLGLVIVDFSDLSHPVVVGQCGIRGAPDQIAFNRDIAYVFDEGGVTLVDVANPQKPVVRRSFNLFRNSYSRSAQFHNDRLYLEDLFRLKIYDATNPDALPSVETIDDVYSFQIHGSVLYTSGAGAILRAWDISDPSNRKLLAEYPGNGGSTMAIAGSRLVVSGDSLRVFDISADGKLTFVEKFSSTNGKLAASGSTVVALASDEISVFEIPDIGPPRRSFVYSGSFPYLDQVVFFGSSLFVHSTTLGIKIFDFVTQTSPTIRNPVRAATYQSGQTVPITWDFEAGPHVWALSLYAGEPGHGREIPITGALTQPSENSFHLDWQIPDSLETSATSMDAYQILVRDTTNGAQGFSDPFTIVDRPKLSYSDQRYEGVPRIYLSWPARFNNSYTLYSKESLDAEWKPEIVNIQISDPTSFLTIEGDALVQPQKFLTLRPKNP